MSFLIFTRVVLSLLFAWCVVVAAYWSFSYGITENRVAAPFVLWMSWPLLIFSMAMLVLTWLPASVQPTEWLIPILYPFLVFVTIRLVFSICLQSFLNTPAGHSIQAPPPPSGFLIWPGVALLSMAAYAFWDVMRTENSEVSRVYRFSYAVVFLMGFYVGIDSLVSPSRPLFQTFDFATGTLVQ